jgi:hypothetical protein
VCPAMVMVPRLLLWMIKQQKREADRLSPSRAEVSVLLYVISFLSTQNLI